MIRRIIIGCFVCPCVYLVCMLLLITGGWMQDMLLQPSIGAECPVVTASDPVPGKSVCIGFVEAVLFLFCYTFNL